MKFFDGPGSLSVEKYFDNVPGQGVKQCFSAFQSFIHVYTFHIENIETYFNFSEDNLRSNTKKELNTVISVVKIAGHPCPQGNSLPCLFSVEAFSDLFLNVTVEDMVHSGKLTTDCHLGGISFYERNKLLLLTEITTVCGNISHSLYRSIYSNDNKILIVIYSYSEYSKISVRFSVSKTTCQIGKVDIRKTKALCYTGRESKKCSDHLASIFDSLELRDNILKHSPSAGDCTILQFGKNLLLSDTDFAEMYWFPNHCLHNHVSIRSNWQKHNIRLTYRGKLERNKIAKALDLNFHITCIAKEDSLGSTVVNSIKSETSEKLYIDSEILQTSEGGFDKIKICGFSDTISWTEIIIKSPNSNNTHIKETLGPHKGLLKTARVVSDATLVFRIGIDMLSQCLLESVLSQERKVIISMTITVKVDHGQILYKCYDWKLHPILSCYEPAHFVFIAMNEVTALQVSYICSISPPSNITAFWIPDKPGFKWKTYHAGQKQVHESQSNIGRYVDVVHSQKLTWTEAHKYCRDNFNGSLPILLDKGDLEELVLIMKDSRNFDELKVHSGFFIGMKVGPAENMYFLSCWWCLYHGLDMHARSNFLPLIYPLVCHDTSLLQL